jgi:hypothetical protein
MPGVDDRIDRAERLAQLCDGHPNNVEEALSQVLHVLSDEEHQPRGEHDLCLPVPCGELRVKLDGETVVLVLR